MTIGKRLWTLLTTEEGLDEHGLRGCWLELDTVSAPAMELRLAAHLVRNEVAAITQDGENSHASKNRRGLREMKTSRHASSHREDQDVMAVGYLRWSETFRVPSPSVVMRTPEEGVGK
jgi:hypothetical protein